MSDVCILFERRKNESFLDSFLYSVEYSGRFREKVSSLRTAPFSLGEEDPPCLVLQGGPPLLLPPPLAKPSCRGFQFGFRFSRSLRSPANVNLARLGEHVRSRAAPLFRPPLFRIPSASIRAHPEFFRIRCKDRRGRCPVSIPSTSLIIPLFVRLYFSTRRDLG